MKGRVRDRVKGWANGRPRAESRGGRGHFCTEYLSLRSTGSRVGWVGNGDGRGGAKQ